jgi:hypothetical protein
VEDLLEPGDRLCLEVARERGSLEAIVCRMGVDDEAECAMRDHFEAMVRTGLLERLGVRGSRSKMQDAKLIASYRAAPVGLALLEAIERIEELERQLAQATGSETVRPLDVSLHGVPGVRADDRQARPRPGATPRRARSRA